MNRELTEPRETAESEIVNCGLQRLLDWLCPPRFSRYRPAPRTGTRRVETRLLRRLAWKTAETVQ
jgi:hypothetical protein